MARRLALCPTGILTPGKLKTERPPQSADTTTCCLKPRHSNLRRRKVTTKMFRFPLQFHWSQTVPARLIHYLAKMIHYLAKVIRYLVKVSVSHSLSAK